MIIRTVEESRNTAHTTGMEFECSRCRKVLPVQTSGGTGYGGTADGSLICYACCGELDRESMIETGKAVLYLNDRAGESEVTNWPGSLRFRVGYIRKGRHNIARVRRDFWFSGPNNTTWHGVQYGENSQIARCRRVKG